MVTSFATISSALAIIWVMLIVSKYLRWRLAVLARLFIPGSVVAGFILMFAGPEVAGAMSGVELVPEDVLDVWRQLPALLINVVFAGLFLGKIIPGPRQIWHRAGPVIAYGQAIAWGQYVVGIGLVIAVLAPFYATPPVAGALIEISFEGGHGTAAGLGPTFDAVGFSAGTDLALGLATIGLVGSVLIGLVLINWAARRGLVDPEGIRSPTPELHPDPPADTTEQLAARPATTDAAQPIDPMSLHLGLFAVAIAIGWGLHQLLILLEEHTWGRDGTRILAYLPLFPLAMLGGVAVQVVVSRYIGMGLVDRGLVNRISGAALDILIVAALATLSLTAINDNLGPFVWLAVGGIAWNIFALLVLAPRMLGPDWFAQGIPHFGQAMGMTVSGLMLFRIADPENRSGGLENFGYKQLFFAPIVGGGLFTAAVMPLILAFGPWPLLICTSLLLAVWIYVGERLARKVP
ncbi:sodium/glutamate symporter [Parvibaculum lavamentivorans DS-1]|uniref:Sodium/glutamate symporter n=1 Tax=Parvibaculum lavamentivorans (strain DS-1 / DSM 13023 / NCIMB 13966) TaxID=402881 RepID=A7HR66_PARL1|nr:sodium/glutamate symporter [Parvibaculum lavamentivorans]ABS62399.1 sodium/glutamate symporter [Parvibaculum lavamentivorans DS-1]